jgi:hypothetical protein
MSQFRGATSRKTWLTTTTCDHLIDMLWCL